MSNDKVPASFHPDRGPTPPGGWVDETHWMPSEVINLDEPLSEKDAEVYGEAFREVHVRVYKVYTVQRDGREWVVCPICGPLEGAVLKGHGPNHMVEDASR